ncbi:kinesin-like protein KIN-14Q isoform X2 [Iris pallida]|uniref:Kinesin-like protein KIN-14Q isoform X2 n=1 Tax=Iris pallida TaxID=29817 RepID=A0AAX6I6K8_IRIPA|nr:kinesin-like protein KIN-14Q isoform X2 [Iris pallida]
MASGGAALSMSVASVVEDVLEQHGSSRLSDVDLASRKAHEAATRRSDAARWLRRTVGVVLGKDLPEEPSEEEFRLGLRNGIILCNALNRVQPGAVPKVVEAHGDSVAVPDGAALSAYQYFENVRNFLVALEGMGLPTFEASDLEKGGKGSRVVDSVLALKDHSECKQMGRKYGGILRSVGSGKHFIRKNSDAFMTSLSRSQSMNDKLQDGHSSEHNLSGDISSESTEMRTSHSLNMLVRTVLSDKKPEEVTLLVESMLSRVMQEFERRIASQNEITLKDMSVGSKPFPEHEFSSSSSETKMEAKEDISAKSVEEKIHVNLINEEPSSERSSKHQSILDRQQKEIKELKHILRTARAGMEFMKSQYSEEFNNLGKHLRVLSSAASGYNKVLAENRKLYNQVQDLKGNIRVYCRVRPFLPGQLNGMSTVGRIDDGTITIITPSKYGKEGRRSFNFNKVFGLSASQAEVFSDMQPLIRSVLDGYNVCIFAYGQTGSGKTHTMSGPKELNEQTIGVNYRALNDLFYLSEQRRDTFYYEISVQMIEIYNEQVRDLLVN